MLKIILGIFAIVIFFKIFAWALDYDDDSEEYDIKDNEDE